MTVRDALLGLLTMGPAYGLQLHAELGIRAPHRAKTNVGQVYGTLDRLTTAGLVSSAGLSAEGLPLYALTPAGVQEAKRWLNGESLQGLPEWADIQDMALISSSLHGSEASQLIASLTNFALHEPTAASDSPYQQLNTAAQRRYHDSVVLWLEDLTSASITPDPAFTTSRPKRGRPTKA